jgi:hypothetical protein
MKTTIIAVVLFFAAISLAQTAAQPKSNPDQPQSSTAAQADAKAKCPCCEKMSGAKDSAMCCAHHDDAASNSGMSCCQGKDGKDAMSCSKGDAGCCGNKASGKDQKGCCDQSGKESEAAMSCCAGHEHGEIANHGHCGMMSQHDHGEMNK